MLGGFGLEAGVLVFQIRTGRVRKNLRSPLWALSRSQRRSLRSQVLRNVIEPGTDPAAVRLAATSMADQLWVIWMMAGLATLATGQVLASPSQLVVAAATLVASCFGAAVVVAIRQANRADRFLHDHLPADFSRDGTTTDDPHR
jgi:Flp pilus assembly protein TadB